MNTRTLIACGSVAWLGCALSACTATANIHDNTINIPDATVNFTTDADVSNVMPEQMIPIVVAVQNVYLVEPSATPPAEHVADAGHLQIYLDDVATPPLVVTAQVNVNVTIPAQTPAGNHKLICRVHHHDGTPTDTKFEVSITVKVTTGTVDSGTGSDAAAATDAQAAG